MITKKKIIEVALPLDAINKESAREKSIRHGHPSTLHLWWARRPLAACRAVLFAQIVDDPSSHPEKFPTEEDQDRERQRLFGIIEEMVKWENTNNETVLEKARAEIRKYTGDNPPPVYDPFCGGGSIPLEAQRLGLEAHGSDLNPVAVLITKAMIEIPPKFAGRPPVRPHDEKAKKSYAWKGAQGLAEDVRYYGQWMSDEAQKRIGHLYPKVKLPEENGGGEATVIAWLWARTVKCPNPACGAQMPLVRSFALSTKKDRQAWVEPVIQGNRYEFKVRRGTGKPREGTVNRQGATCLCCGTPVPFPHVRTEGKEGRMGERLMAVVAEGNRGRIYLEPTEEMEKIARSAKPEWKPDYELPVNPRDFKTPNYGMNTFADLFTSRQLVALTTFSDLVLEARDRVIRDAKAAGLRDDRIGLNDGGNGATAYGDAVAVYLAFAVDRMTMTGNSLVRWNSVGEKAQHCFGRQALPMIWDFAEPNFLGIATGSVDAAVFYACNPLNWMQPSTLGSCDQKDAATQDISNMKIVSTDPPYYDNIGYADLSDFFYVWLRRSLKPIFPDLFVTLVVPKADELVATHYRHGSKEKAETFFLDGMTQAMQRLYEQSHPAFPVTIYYAFKQSESVSNGSASTGWETFLEAVLSAGFSVSGTWPMRTEMKTRQIAMGSNALASSIILVCRKRPVEASMTTRRDFLNILKRELPAALKKLQQNNIAPVDMAQAAIGPGMAVFSRYSKVLEADGSAMRVRDALALINQALDEYLAEQEGEYDADTRWALAWFEQYSMNDGPYGIAETLSTAKNTSVSGLVEAGFLFSKSGKVRLLGRGELSDTWDPVTDKRLTIWEVTQHLIKKLVDAGSEEAAAILLKKVGALGEAARNLAYRLYSICERKKWAQEARAYNSLVVAWPDLVNLAKQQPATGPGRQDTWI
ncbi:MAG: DUF1156 domain-containing protein [Deltaproteobacteria bacterium]|nr:DUF1156 domain-containing protein [Deltaproteobacteria bacterium]